MIYTIYHKGFSIPVYLKGTGEITGYLGETVLVKMATCLFLLDCYLNWLNDYFNKVYTPLVIVLWCASCIDSLG